MKRNYIFAALLALGVSSWAAADSLPSEIFRPFGAQVTKADTKGNGEFEAEFRVRGIGVHRLAQQVSAYARRQGFVPVEQEIKRDDADLKFKRGRQKLDVEIEQKDHGVVEYKADLDNDD